MTDTITRPHTAFEGGKLLARGPLAEVALAVKHASEKQAGATLVVFDDASGRIVDLDLRGSDADAVARLTAGTPAQKPRREADPDSEPRGRGRPKLGVVGREVTLLPRHWEWLAAQPGGASVALRKLVDEARRSGAAGEKARRARDAAYHFISAMAGDLPGFEEAARALFAGDPARFAQQMARWPEDVRATALRLAHSAPTGR